MNLTRKDIRDIVENSMSWIVVFAMFVYGGAKFLQFRNEHLLGKLVADMTGMELMWAFYGYSKGFVVVLGILEIAGGILLFIRKTRLVGCFWISAILVNVILQDIFYSVNTGALVAAVLYQLIILIILWINRQKVKGSVKALLLFSREQLPGKKRLLKLSCAVILFLLFRVAEYFLTVSV